MLPIITECLSWHYLVLTIFIVAVVLFQVIKTVRTDAVNDFCRHWDRFMASEVINILPFACMIGDATQTVAYAATDILNCWNVVFCWNRVQQLSTIYIRCECHWFFDRFRSQQLMGNSNPAIAFRRYDHLHVALCIGCIAAIRPEWSVWDHSHRFNHCGDIHSCDIITDEIG